MEYKFRALKAEEIECKVNAINEKGLSLLLYKTARVDMDILDETVGPDNWQRDHKECKGNLFCGIGIYDEYNTNWIWKYDCGVESAFGDKQKGEASDSFKRAGFCWGIGRELYTAPFIYIPADKVKMYDTGRKDKNGKVVYSTYDKFYVEAIKYDEERNIIALSIKNNRNDRVFLLNPPKKEGANNEWRTKRNTKLL